MAAAETGGPCTGRPPHAVTLTWRGSVCVERFTDGETEAEVISNRRGGATWVPGNEPTPSGHPLAGTSRVCAEVAVVAPEPFRAVTFTRNVWPWSAIVTV